LTKWIAIKPIPSDFIRMLQKLRHKMQIIDGTKIVSEDTELLVRIRVFKIGSSEPVGILGIILVWPLTLEQRVTVLYHYFLSDNNSVIGFTLTLEPQLVTPSIPAVGKSYVDKDFTILPVQTPKFTDPITSINSLLQSTGDRFCPRWRGDIPQEAEDI